MFICPEWRSAATVEVIFLGIGLRLDTVSARSRVDPGPIGSLSLDPGVPSVTGVMEIDKLAACAGFIPNWLTSSFRIPSFVNADNALNDADGVGIWMWNPGFLFALFIADGFRLLIVLLVLLVPVFWLVPFDACDGAWGRIFAADAVLVGSPGSLKFIGCSNGLETEFRAFIDLDGELETGPPDAMSEVVGGGFGDGVFNDPLAYGELCGV